jgi:hypothetical protein
MAFTLARYGGLFRDGSDEAVNRVRGPPAQAEPVRNGSLLGGCTPSALLSPLLSRPLRPDADPADRLDCGSSVDQDRDEPD